MLTYFLMNSYINYGSCSLKVNINSRMSSNFGYHALKFIRKNSDTYKSMMEKNSSVLPSKAFVKREILLLTTGRHICTKKKIAK